MPEKSPYKSLNDWRNVNPKDYAVARYHNWLDDICDKFGWVHQKKTKPQGYWTNKENVLIEAKKYNGRSEWMRGSSSSYSSARKNGWVDEATAHMKPIRKPIGYWENKEKCLEEARKHKKITEWQRASSTSVNSARRNGWFDECTAHIKRTRKPHGYWSVKENVLTEVIKYDTTSEWQRISSASYKTARKNGWYDEATAHIKRTRKPRGYWTKKRVLTEAKKYKTKADWVKFNNSSSNSAFNNGWYDEATAHMKPIRKPIGYWENKEKCLEEARKHKKITEWQRASSTSVNSARRNGWFDECTSHMIDKIKWTKERCIVEAKKYKYRSDFQYKSGSCYQITRRNGWLDECCQHMIKKIRNNA